MNRLRIFLATVMLACSALVVSVAPAAAVCGAHVPTFTVYDQPSYAGSSHTWCGTGQNVYNLTSITPGPCFNVVRPWSWQDCIASVKIANFTTTTRLCMFQDAGYSGTEILVDNSGNVPAPMWHAITSFKFETTPFPGIPGCP